MLREAELLILKIISQLIDFVDSNAFGLWHKQLAFEIMSSDLVAI